MRLVQLDEIVVTAPSIERKTEPRLQYSLNTLSDVTIRREDIERLHYHYAAENLSTLPAVEVIINPITGECRVFINRGIGAFERKKPALIIIDGVAGDFDSLSGLRSDEVESIDVFKNVSTAAFGTRGANGVISVTTRTGIGRDNDNRMEDVPNYNVYSPSGYQKPVEFYSPKYETLESKHLTIPDYRTTIFWKPDIVISNDIMDATFEFYTSDFPTTYSVVIEGLTDDGRIVRQVEKIRVE